MAVFYGPQLKLHIEFIEGELAKSTWFAGNELTGAGTFVHRYKYSCLDIMMSFPLQISLVRANIGGMDVSRMRAFLKRMEERPAYKRVIEKVGPIGLEEA